MFYEVITGTDIMFYLMIAVGVIGGVASCKFVYASSDGTGSRQHVKEHTQTDKTGTREI